MAVSKWMRLAAAVACLLLPPETHAVTLTGYEYIVVGSGAGGGPLAARLALAGHKTLLIESGDDHGASDNYTVPAYHARMTEDPGPAWDFYVRHYADDARQARDWKTSYDTPSGEIYTGLDPPPGSTMKGVLYPRAGALGGCAAHNAMVFVYPHQSDFEHLVELTGDDSWSPANMRRHFVNLEKKRYLPGLPTGHGFDGWMPSEVAPLTLPLGDPQLLSVLMGGAFALGNLTGSVVNIATLLAGDLNAAATAARDVTPAYYQIPLSTSSGARVSSREFVLSVRDARNRDGSKRYPLDVRLNCHVTRVTFNGTIATGVEFLDGEHLYRASPLSSSSKSKNQSDRTGTPGTATATREVILSAGTYNSPQILKLSGVGPKAELDRFNITVVTNLPGVGANLQDHYETSVNVKVPLDWPALAGCTFTGDPSSDSCLRRWEAGPLPLTFNDRGTYASNGFAAALLYASSSSELSPSTSSSSEAGIGNNSNNNKKNFDVFLFGGPANFRGYYPSYSTDATSHHDWWSWAILKSHPRNRAGRVTLRSADPLDTPEIVYNYFDTGSEGWEKDVAALREGIELARDALRRQLVPTEEVLPGEKGRDLEKYVMDGAWGHHASSTCPIGADGDTMAVLDSKFRVRGVTGLRVVDASVYPRIPGTFTALSTYMVAEKAAEDILGEL